MYTSTDVVTRGATYLCHRRLIDFLPRRFHAIRSPISPDTINEEDYEGDEVCGDDPKMYLQGEVDGVIMDAQFWWITVGHLSYWRHLTAG